MILFKRFFLRFIFISFVLAIFLTIGFILFKPIYLANSVTIPYSLHPYDICIRYPDAWNKIKLYFVLFYFLATVLLRELNLFNII